MLKKAKEALTNQMTKYVDKVLLPSTYTAYCRSTSQIENGLVDSVKLSYDQWCALVLECTKEVKA